FVPSSPKEIRTGPALLNTLCTLSNHLRLLGQNTLTRCVMKSRPPKSRNGQPSEEPKKINAELSDLFHQQNEALENAVFIGMTVKQSEAFEERRERIAELTARLATFKDAA